MSLSSSLRSPGHASLKNGVANLTQSARVQHRLKFERSLRLLNALSVNLTPELKKVKSWSRQSIQFKIKIFKSEYPNLFDNATSISSLLFLLMSGNTERTELEAHPRMRTREKNADVHPGEKLKEVLRSHQSARPHEVIQKEKTEKAATQQARAQAKLLKAAGEERASQLEKEKKDLVALENKHIPRRLPVNKKGN